MKKVGTSPLNARIMVDYDKKDISFSYPGGHGSFKKRFNIICEFVAIPVFIIYCVMISIMCIICNMSSIITLYNSRYTSYDDGNGIIRLVSLLGAMIVTTLVISFIITWKYERFASTFPKIQYRFYSLCGGKKEIRIKSIDSDEFVLPTFKNIVLDYELEGDFADKIKYVNVVDYPFDIYYNGKSDGNFRMWKAVFKFRERPTSGSISLRFI